MTSKTDLMNYAHDVVTSHAAVKIVPTATAGVGFSTAVGWLTQGIGLAVTLLGAMVTIAIWRKVKLETKEAELRIRVLEDRLSDS